MSSCTTYKKHQRPIMKETNMLAMQKQTAETTLRLFQNNPERESGLSVLSVTENIRPRPLVVRRLKLLPKERQACDMATD